MEGMVLIFNGGEGNDYLNGGVWIDQMNGGLGDDRYIVDMKRTL